MGHRRRLGRHRADYAGTQPNLAAPYSVGGVWSTGVGSVMITGAALTLNSATVNGNPSIGVEMDPGAGR